MLKKRYYMGTVTFRGLERPGRHLPLVSPEMFEQVQTVMDSHRMGGQKQRRHNHYLRGSVFCGQNDCGQRMCYMEGKGIGGTYPYFFCLGRKKKLGCEQPYTSAESIEDEIARHYLSATPLTVEEAQELRLLILDTAAHITKVNKEEIARQERRLAKLERESVKLLQAHYEEAIPMALLKSEQARIAKEKAQAAIVMERSRTEFVAVQRNLDIALDLATNCNARYAAAPAVVRRLINQALYEGFVIYGDELIEARLREPIRTLREVAERQRVIARQFEEVDGMKGADSLSRLRAQVASSFSQSLNKTLLVRVKGVEPSRGYPHTDLNRARLPFRHPPGQRRIG